MKIYTGYFARIRSYKEAGLHPVSIARFNRYFPGDKLEELAPTPEMIHMDEVEYRPKYIQILRRNRTTDIFQKLEVLSKGKDAILLCYEKNGEFCHRHMVAEWLSKNLEIEVKEWGLVKKPEEVQMKLL